MRVPARGGLAKDLAARICVKVGASFSVIADGAFWLSDIIALLAWEPLTQQEYEAVTTIFLCASTAQDSQANSTFLEYYEKLTMRWHT